MLGHYRRGVAQSVEYLSILKGDTSKIIINRNTPINTFLKQCIHLNTVRGKNIFIGENSLLYNNIEIHTSDYHSIMDENITCNYASDVIIGKHVWIGMQTLILKGCRIPDNCVIGAKTLVSKSFIETHIVITGNFCKVVKKNINKKK